MEYAVILCVLYSRVVLSVLNTKCSHPRAMSTTAFCYDSLRGVETTYVRTGCMLVCALLFPRVVFSSNLPSISLCLLIVYTAPALQSVA
jgi:hypothetical protein